MSIPDVRRCTMDVLRETLRELVNQPPGCTSAEKQMTDKAWAYAKDLYALRAKWFKDGYNESNEQRAQTEHWYRLLSAVLDPRSG